jgi:ring-1,2-phenylacetyl-CoA epoxidase subunit PaaE
MHSAFHTLTVSDVTPETDDAVCVSFSVPAPLAALFEFKPGQYLTLRKEVQGDLVSRSYSICVPPSAGSLKVAVKRVPDGVFSNFVNDHLKPGDAIEVMTPQGHFSIDVDTTAARNYLFIAAGSGITPIMSNIEAVLASEPESRVTLLYGNQRTGTIMFRQTLSFLKNRYLGRFNWINILSRESQDAPILNGRIDNKKGAELNAQLVDLKGFDLFMLCGPESMISEVSRGLRSLGIDESQILYELFGSSAEDAAERVARHHARAEAYAGKLCKVTIVADGRTSEINIAADGENLLDAGINIGIDLPYACKGGVCSTCKALLVEGEVEMDVQHGLTSQEVANGMILTCQAHPISDRVVVDFDKRWAGE